jgi:hypothetical protein
VRYVQVWHGEGQPWDSHDAIGRNHARLAKECDQAIGALLDDLVAMGLLESTLVLWGGEFGRTPTVELPQPGTDIKEISGMLPVKRCAELPPEKIGKRENRRFEINSKILLRRVAHRSSHAREYRSSEDIVYLYRYNRLPRINNKTGDGSF